MTRSGSDRAHCRKAETKNAEGEEGAKEKKREAKEGRRVSQSVAARCYTQKDRRLFVSQLTVRE